MLLASLFSLFFIFKYTYKQNYEILSVTRTHRHTVIISHGFWCQTVLAYVWTSIFLFFSWILLALITPLVSTHISALIRTSVLTFLQHYSDFSLKRNQLQTLLWCIYKREQVSKARTCEPHQNSHCHNFHQARKWKTVLRFNEYFVTIQLRS